MDNKFTVPVKFDGKIVGYTTQQGTEIKITNPKLWDRIQAQFINKPVGISSRRFGILEKTGRVEVTDILDMEVINPKDLISKTITE